MPVVLKIALTISGEQTALDSIIATTSHPELRSARGDLPENPTVAHDVSTENNSSGYKKDPSVEAMMNTPRLDGATLTKWAAEYGPEPGWIYDADYDEHDREWWGQGDGEDRTHMMSGGKGS